MRNLPIPKDIESREFSVYIDTVIDILLGRVGAITISRVRELHIDIDDFDFLLVVAGADPEAADFTELNKLALEELVRYITEADNER
jgi:hypothetical protein